MKKNKTKKVNVINVISYVLVLLLCFSVIPISETDADTNGQNPKKLGLLFVANGMDGSGFNKNYFYLTEEEIEMIKDDPESIKSTPLGDSYKSEYYSSYDDHGPGTYHYNTASGIIIETALSNLGLDTSSSSINRLRAYSSDGFSADFSKTGQLKDIFRSYYRYDPGETVSTTSVPAMIALYKSSHEVAASSEGAYPAIAARCGVGENVYIYGQMNPLEDNNCNFVKDLDTIVINSLPSNLIAENDEIKGSLNLMKLMRLGIYSKEYAYESSDSSSITFKTEGFPLSKVVDAMGISQYAPKGSTNKYAIKNINGEITYISIPDMEESFLALDVTEGTDPVGRSNEYAVFTAGNNEDESVIANVVSVGVVDAAGNLVADISSPSITAPKNFSAETTGYNAISLSWNKVSGAAGYYLYRYNSKTKKYQKYKALSPSATSFKDSHLNTGTKYSYRIAAYKTVYGLVYESNLSAVVAATPSLSKPKITRIKKSGKNKVRIQWKKVSGASGYVLYQATKKNGKYKKIKIIKKGNAVKYIKKGLKKGKKYFYQIKAYRKVGGVNKYSGFSNKKSIKG